MATQSPRLKISLPEGTDNVTRASFNQRYGEIDNGVQILGTTNQEVNKIKAIGLKADTRTTELVYTAGNLTQVLEKDGTAIVKTTTLNYDAQGNLDSVVEVASGTTVTTTLNYTAGQLTSVSKAVI